MRDLPTPTESPDLLRRYLRQPPYAALTDNEYITVMQEAITLWPNSRFAHAGLAEAYLGSGHDKSTTVQNKQLAVASFRTAATLAQSQGLTRYIDRVADLYADLGDVENLQGLVNALGSIVHTNYGVAAGLGVACARLNMDSAESLLLSAITLDPGAAAYEYYVNFLFDRNRSQDVLNLLTPEVGTKMMAWLYHAYRCKALANLGRTEEATPECDLANDEPHPGELVAAPSAPPSEEQPKQENDLA
jgi:tetratricopeptide (TPR) repeat protein